MATVDLRGATAAVDIRTADLVKFGTLSGTPSATTWSYQTPTGNRVIVSGTGLQYDANGNPVAGTVASIEIDVAGNGSADVVITGLGAAASPLGSILRSSPLDFWQSVLGGRVSAVHRWPTSAWPETASRHAPASAPAATTSST